MHWWGALRVRRTWNHLSLALRNGQTHISICTSQVYKARQPFTMEAWHLSVFLEEYAFPIAQMLLALDSWSLPWPELGARHCELPRYDSQNLVFRIGHCIIWGSCLNVMCTFLAPLPSGLVLPSGHLVAGWLPAVPDLYPTSSTTPTKCFLPLIVPAQTPDEP